MATTAGDLNSYTFTVNTDTQTINGGAWTNAQWIRTPSTTTITQTTPDTFTNLPDPIPAITMDTGKRIPGGIVYQAIVEGDLDSIYYCYVFGSNHILINKIDKEGESNIVSNEETGLDTTAQQIHDMILKLISGFLADSQITTPAVTSGFTLPIQKMEFQSALSGPSTLDDTQWTNVTFKEFLMDAPSLSTNETSDNSSYELYSNK